MRQFALNQIRGVIPALITCFDEQDALDEQRLRSVVRHLMRYAIGGLYLAGTTGEGLMMTTQERMRVVEITAEETGCDIPLIVHVGAMSVKEAKQLAQHAQAVGAHAISSIPPTYYRFSNDRVSMPALLTETAMSFAHFPLANLPPLSCRTNCGFRVSRRAGITH